MTQADEPENRTLPLTRQEWGWLEAMVEAEALKLEAYQAKIRLEHGTRSGAYEQAHKDVLFADGVLAMVRGG